MVLLLSRQDVTRLLDMDALLAVLEQAHSAHATGGVVMPVRLTLRYDDRPSELEAMPAFIRSIPALGMKTIQFVATNRAQGMPNIHALIMLMDPHDGRPVAIMEGSYVTAMRTAAASALATRLLARPDAHTLAIIGSGVQARSHLQAMFAVRPVQSVCIHSRTPAHAAALAKECTEAHPEVAVRVASTVRDAVRDADLIVTATTAQEPILHWEWLRSGAHINAIGSHSPDCRELAPEVVERAWLVVDSREATLQECGDFQMAIAEGMLTADAINVELGQVVAGLRPGRQSDSEVTLYKSGGIALQDVATAHLVYERALERKMGVHFDF